MNLNPYNPPIDLQREWGSSHRVTVKSLGFIALFFGGFFGATYLLAVAAELSGLPIRGLPCTRGWREAVHAISHIASLYPLFVAVGIFLGWLRVPAAWSHGGAAIALGFTVHLIWVTSLGAFPTAIESITPPPGLQRFVSVAVHGLSHVFLVWIGFRIGEHLRRRSCPRLRPSDYGIIATLLLIWMFAIIETKTSFQHAWIRWLSFATLMILAGRSSQNWSRLLSRCANDRHRASGA